MPKKAIELKNFLTQTFSDDRGNEYSKIPATSLVGWWQMGSSAPIDAGPHSISASYENVTTTGTSTFGQKTYGTATFDNTNDRNAVVAATSKLSFSSLGDGGTESIGSDKPFSVSFWATHTGGITYFFGKKTNEYGAYYTPSNGTIKFWVAGASGSPYSMVTTSDISSLINGKFAHIVCVYDAVGNQPATGNGSAAQDAWVFQNLRVYVNGKNNSASGNMVGNYKSMRPDHSNPLYIGGSHTGANEHTGQMAEFAIWSYNLKDSEVKAIYNYTQRTPYTSGFTTQLPRVAQQINDNMEDRSYVARDYSLNSRSIVGKSFVDNKFDDTLESQSPSRRRQEMISLRAGVDLIDKVKFYIRGADGLAFKTFAITSGDDSAWDTNGGLSATDIKVDVTNYMNAVPAADRSDEVITLLIAQALGEAIQKEVSLKLDVSVKYNAIFLKDKNVESISVASFENFKPPRAIHHPRVRLQVADGNATLDTGSHFAEKQSLILQDGTGYSKKYVLVDSQLTVVTTGTVLASDSDTGLETAGASNAGGIAVAVNLTGGSPSTQNALLVQLRLAILSANGHGGRILVKKVPVQANGVQTIDIISALPPIREGSGFSYTDSLGGLQFNVLDSDAYHQKIERPTCTITTTTGTATTSLPAELSIVTIVTGDGTSRKYVTVIDSGTTVATGDILSAGSDTGAGNSLSAGHAAIGGIAVALGTNRYSYIAELKKALTSQNGHGKKIKIASMPTGAFNETQSLIITDVTSGFYAPEVGSPVRSAVETVAVESVTFSDWSKKGVSGGKIVESIFGNELKKIFVEIINPHGLENPVVHGINHAKKGIAKNSLVGHSTLPDLVSSVEPSPGSGYSTYLPLIASGTIHPFKEENLISAFSAAPGNRVNADKSYLARKGEAVSRKSVVGPGFQSDISSKECITIEIDGTGASDQILYPEGTGASNEDRPTTAYLNPVTGQWTALTGDLACDKTFPGGSGGSEPSGNWDVHNQIAERSHVGFGQGQRNMFRMISAPIDADGSFVQGSFKMSAESFEAEKDRYAFIESAHNPCINSFGFPSHPKFAASSDNFIDMAKYIDEDFLVENIVISCQIKTSEPTIHDYNETILDTSLTYDARKSGYGEVRPSGCTFFLLSQRKAFLPIGIAQNTFQLEQDPTGVTNSRIGNVSKENISLPGWYPTGARQAWTRGTSPSTIIYNGGAATTVNDSDHADSTGWSFKALASDGTTNAAFAVNSSRLHLKSQAFITTSTTEDTYHKGNNTTRTTAPPYFIPIEEGYDPNVYLTTSEAYRLRFFGKRGWSGSNTEATKAYIYVYATYLDDLLANNPSGVRNIVAFIALPENDTIVDLPLKTVYDGAARKFNLSIKVTTHGGTFDDNYFDLRSMEIYRVANSSYVETIRDIVGWGPVGVFPTEFDDRVGSKLSSKAIDPRDSYALIIEDDNSAVRNLNVSFPPKAPARGDFGTFGKALEDPNHIISNWDSIGRSGIIGVPSDRSVICSTSPGVEAMYISRQYASYWEVPQPKSQALISPYLLKKTDNLIVGAQSLTSYMLSSDDQGGTTNVTLKPSKITIKLYGSRVSNGKGSYAQTSENLSSNAVHEVVGNNPVRDQFETDPSYMYEGTYLDNILYGDPSLTQFLRGGELVDVGVPRSYTGDVVGLVPGFDMGKIRPWGFGSYGDFDPFLPTFQSVASPPSTFPAGEKFLVTDQDGLSKIYLSSTAVSAGSPSQNGSDTDTVGGTTADVIRFNNGGSSNFQDGVRELALAINHSNGHNGGHDTTKHLIAVESTFDSTVTDKKHVLQIIPRVKSREEADEYDSGGKSLTIVYDPVGTSYWSTNKSPRYEHLGGASLKACGIPMVAHAWQWNWHRKTKDFNRGVVARSSYGTAGITGSFQTFVQLKEDAVFKYDSLVIPTYEFLSMFDVAVPWNASGPSTSSPAPSPSITGSFLPIFQRSQIINQLGGLQTGYINISNGSAADGTPDAQGFNKNVTNLWARWPLERGDRRSISALNPTTFRCDVWMVSTTQPKQAIPICRVQVPDMNRLDGSKLDSSNTVTAINAHYSASLVGFGRGNGTVASSLSSLDGVSSHLRRTPSTTGETEWASYSPRENLDIRKKTLKALFGFETSHYMRWGTSEKYLHRLSNGNEFLYYRARFKPSFEGGTTFTDMLECGDKVSRAHIVVRGMRYGIDNYIPTEDKVYMRHNRYGQFRDLLEQRKFYVSCDENGERLPDVPVEVKFVSRPVFDDLGNISANRKEGVSPASTNSQNLSTYATASIPYVDDWEKNALGNSVWLYGRDRSSAQPDLKDVVTNIQLA